ncbi:MAG: hypothetical protein CSA52_00790 [Gammaproteobacteria bacterium]|nr:MAG: hypothetical protein CSB48_08265 [Pseudomonadota bacterium]PIE38880.1 MAG: hypothetical protein CSA52_00790 [Gammaproteobacteria bacterium]
MNGHCQKSTWQAKHKNTVPPMSLEPIIVRVTGYGTYKSARGKVTERQRLMAMRASKLDAFRSLAERVYGMVIYGSSTVKDFALENDQFRTWVDSYIRGAKIIAVNEMAGGAFETVVELVLESRFRECLTHTNHFRYTEECRMLLSSGKEMVRNPGKTPGSGAQYYF